MTLHARNHAQARALSDRAFTEGALIVAAPVSAEFVQEWLCGRVPREIFDLRDISSSDRIVAPGADLHVLEEIFSQIESTKKRLEPVIALARAEIQTLSEKIASQAIIRPLGWDDLCA